MAPNSKAITSHAQHGAAVTCCACDTVYINKSAFRWDEEGGLVAALLRHSLF